MVVDIIIITILIIFIFFGIKRGFAYSIITLFGASVNSFLAFLLTNPFKMLLTRFGLTGLIKTTYATKMAGMAGFETNLVGMEANALNEHVTATINSSGFSGLTKTLTRWFCKITPEQIADRESVTLTDILSKAYSLFWITLISFVVAFLIIYLILFLLTKLVRSAKEHKSFNFVDNSLGFLFGFVRGTIYICLIIGIIALFKEDGILSWLIAYIKEAKIGGWVYSWVNPFVDKYINFDSIITAAQQVMPQ